MVFDSMLTQEQKQYYVLGLNDAIEEIRAELTCSELSLSSGDLATARGTCMNCIGLIEDKIIMTGIYDQL
jgi:hypothetical protein